MVDPLDHTRRRVIDPGTPGEDLLVPVLRGGRPVREAPPLSEVRARAAAQLGRVHAGVKRLVHPHSYPVGLERGLYDLRTRLILEAREAATRRTR
jgi:nicotinate phosphoribosyltransferase